jgi:lipoate-protein ligase A
MLHLFSSLVVYRDSVPHSAAINMAIDEALLEHASVASIRFYKWRSPALSFGYFGKSNDVAAYAPQRELVRRWTGGGIVFHGEDLTYSIVIPASDPLFNEASPAIYEKVHRALCHALNELGERAMIAQGAEPHGIALANRAAVSASGYNCFANPVRADVIIDSRKIAGAAQRRTRHALLQQGSIQGVNITNDLVERFTCALSSKQIQLSLNTEILNRARELAEQKYATHSWLHRY